MLFFCPFRVKSFTRYMYKVCSVLATLETLLFSRPIMEGFCGIGQEATKGCVPLLKWQKKWTCTHTA